MNRNYIFLLILFLFISCKGESPSETKQQTPPPSSPEPEVSVNDEILQKAKIADPDLEEKIRNLKPKANNNSGAPIELKGVNLSYPLLPHLVRKGEVVYKNQCASCHLLSDQKSKASGFIGITVRREPVWIMNMLTGVHTQLANKAIDRQKLKRCPVTTPEQRLSIEGARDMLEFLRHNDGED